MYAQAVHARTQLLANSVTVPTNANVRRVTQGNDAKVGIFVYTIITVRLFSLDYENNIF